MTNAEVVPSGVIPVNPTTMAEPAGHFDRAVRIGDFLYISGTSALTNLSGTIAERALPDSFEEQARTTFDNIEKVLEFAGGTLADIYELRVILSDREDFGPLNDIFRERMPKRGFIGHGYVAEFLAPGMKIEVEANAYLPQQAGSTKKGQALTTPNTFINAVSAGDVEVVDLTTPLHSETPIVRVPPPFAPTAGLSVQPVSNFDEAGPAWCWNDITLGEHAGTHVDAPRHWISGRDGLSIDQIPPNRLVGPIAVVDKTAEVAADANFHLEAAHLDEWERENGPLEPGTWVIFRTGWSAYGADADAFLPETGWPGLSADGAKWLAEHPSVSGFGVETVGVDSLSSGAFDPPYPGHHLLLGADTYGLTSLRNVDQLPITGATIVVAPLPIVGGTGAPARVFAFVQR